MLCPLILWPSITNIVLCFCLKIVNIYRTMCTVSLDIFLYGFLYLVREFITCIIKSKLSFHHSSPTFEAESYVFHSFILWKLKLIGSWYLTFDGSQWKHIYNVDTVLSICQFISPSGSISYNLSTQLFWNLAGMLIGIAIWGSTTFMDVFHSLIVNYLLLITINYNGQIWFILGQRLLMTTMTCWMI
jgi:hypothetical protein